MDLFYSTDFSGIVRPDLKGWCLHLICKKGTGGFIFNQKLYVVKKNDIVIVPKVELITKAEAGKNMEVEYIFGEMKFINAQLPVQHYGIKGQISLFKNPLIHGTHHDIQRLHLDMANIVRRLKDTEHFYYDRIIGQAVAQMVFDLFDVHQRHEGFSPALTSASSVVKQLIDILDTGTAMQHREVSWYAEQLNVSPRYLSETVKRLTGDNVVFLINRYAGPIITNMLQYSNMTISEISDKMEFSSLSYFSRYTKKVLKISPSEFRTSHDFENIQKD